MTKRRPAKKHKPGLISHHKHTGKVLPKHHTSYPLVGLLLVLVGALLSVMTVSAVANPADITVIARVPGIPPSQAAVIESPVAGNTFTDSSIPVSGTCETAAVIKIYNNTIYKGSTLCSGAGTFSIQTDLFAGSNSLVAHSYNLADNEGPESDPVVVTYNPPVPPEPEIPPTSTTPTATDNTGGTPSATPLTLTTDDQVRGYNVGQEVRVEISLDGGESPYAVQIDWGDGQIDIISRPKSGVLSATHVYNKPGDFLGSYNIKVRITDAKGEERFLQMLVFVNQPDGAVTALAPTIKPPSGITTAMTSDIYKALAMSWPVYGVALTAFIAFWLGEKRAELALANIKLPRARMRHKH